MWKLEDGPKKEEKNDAVSEQKDENSTIDEKPLEKAEMGDQKNENSEDHKNLIARDRISVNDAHEKDNKTYLS